MSLQRQHSRPEWMAIFYEPTCQWMLKLVLKDVSPTALFDNMQVILCLIREQDSISLTTNKHFHPGAMKGREVWGGYSIITHYPLLSSLLRSRLCRSSRRSTTQKKSCVSEHFLSTAHHVPFKLLLLSVLKTEPMYGIQKKLSKCIIWGAFNLDNINWQSFVHLRFLRFV